MAKKKAQPPSEDGNGLDPRLDKVPKKKTLKKLPNKEQERMLEVTLKMRTYGRPGQICGFAEEVARTLGVRFFQDLRVEARDSRGGETYFAEVAKSGQMNAAGVVRSEKVQEN